MRILHVIPSLAPRYGGPSLACIEMCRALADRGHDVNLFTTNVDGSGTLDVPLGGPVRANGFRCWYFPVQRPRAWVTSLPLARRLWKEIPEHDVVHIHSLYLFPTAVAAYVCRRFAVPYLMRPHGTLDPFLRRRHRGRKWLYSGIIERRNLNAAAAIHFTTNEERELAARIGICSRQVVVPLGVRIPDEGRVADGALTDLFSELAGRQVVLFLGRLNFKKGLDLLIPAFAQVVRSIPHAHLLIAGSDNDGYGSRVRAWVQEHGLGARVTLAGLLIGTAKWAALRGAEVFVLPSYTENFGLSVVEAMAAGLPVIISDRVNIRKDVENAGAGIVVPPTVEVLARALVTLMDDHAARARMGAAGQALARGHFTWARAAEQLEGVYELVTARRQQDGIEGAKGFLRAPLGS